MSSKRRVNDVSIRHCDESEIEKYLAVLQKFKPHMKRFYIYGFSLQEENFFSLMIAASDVETLRLNVDVLSRNVKRRDISLRRFSNLRNLWLSSCPEEHKLFDAIPDDSLEKLEVKGGLYSKSTF